ncbi:MAG: hypothetical protein ACTHMP_22470 [Thermomicrobiales bacterium]
MARTLHQTPRHLDAPIRIGPLTLAQWLIVIVAILLVWLVLTQLVFLPAFGRVGVGGVVVGLALGFAESGPGRSIGELPPRSWHSLQAPREYLSGPPAHGPLRLALYAGKPAKEDLPDA